MPAKYLHQSVLLEEVIKFLEPKPGSDYVDCTLGGGGHAKEILKRNAPGKLFGFELDDRAIQAAQSNLEEYATRLSIIPRSYVHLKEELSNKKIKVGGILMDLGLSSDQLSAEVGFSFKDQGPLDMRFDRKSNGLTASDIIMNWTPQQLEKIFREYGGVKKSRRLAFGLALWRQNLKQKQKFLKTSMLVSAILRILNIKEENLKKFRIHPATQVFQAIRIAVNGELDNLAKTLPQAIDILRPGGRLATISFHSAEDRIIKNFFRSMAKGCICPPEAPVCKCNQKPLIKIINKKGIRPQPEEIMKNPRSRSAILRVAQKI